MLKRLKLSISVIFLVFSSTSFAEKYFDGNQVLQMCQAQSQTMSAGCAMFIVGSAESLRMVGYSDVKYCLSQGISNQQLRQEFVTFLMQHPDSLNYSAASLFLASLIQSHSCEQKE